MKLNLTTPATRYQAGRELPDPAQCASWQCRGHVVSAHAQGRHHQQPLNPPAPRLCGHTRCRWTISSTRARAVGWQSAPTTKDDLYRFYDLTKDEKGLTYRSSIGRRKCNRARRSPPPHRATRTLGDWRTALAQYKQWAHSWYKPQARARRGSRMSSTTSSPPRGAGCAIRPPEVEDGRVHQGV